MATALIVALRGGARCVILPGVALSWPHGITQDHPFKFQQVLPMFPVNSVTYVPGCSRTPSDRRANDIPPRYLPRSERMRVSGMASRPIPHQVSRMDNSGAETPTNRSRFVMSSPNVSYFLAVARLVS